jgi:flagellar hook protein FlgE
MQRILVDPAYYDVSISANGQVVGLNVVTSESTVIGQVILATFPNPNGLQKTGENAYRTTVNSGDPAYNTPGEGGTGALNPGSLEMSNVDLTSQFADMIVTQRGFQANARIITTTDSMLEELVNMVR